MRARPMLAAVLLLTLTLHGCSTVPTIRENTGVIRTSTETIAGNTEAVGRTSETLASLEPSMNRLADLRGPMESLREPLLQVASLGPEMEGVPRLQGPLGEMSARVSGHGGRGDRIAPTPAFPLSLSLWDHTLMDCFF